MLSFTVNHTPYLQLGNAPLTGYGSGLDQAELIWQTTGTQGTDAFTAQVRLTGDLNWSNVTLNADMNTGVDDGPGVRINHSATLTGLSFNDDYDYLITHVRDGSPIATYQDTFHTRLGSDDQSDFTFVTYGDSASGDPPTNFIAVQNRINLIDPAFSLLLGDNVYSSGTHAEYDLRLDPSKNASLTTYNKTHIDYFAFGNHDVGYLSGQAARENYSMPIPVQGVTSPASLVFDADVQAEENYSYDYGSVHFLTFDTNNWQNAVALNKQLDWAVADITAARARPNPPTWVVVFGHHPITSLGGHTEHTPDDYYYDQVVSRLGHGPGGMAVDLLLAGHAHNYQRSYPLTGHSGATATYVLDTDNNYAKGAGLPLVVQGVGGVGIGYGATDATFAGTYLAKALDSNTSVAAQYGFGKVDVTPTTLTYSYVNTLGEVLDSFTIGPPPPDTTAPIAVMSVPLDNGITDQNPAANQLTLSTAPAHLQIHLTDIGDGVDDASVVSSAINVSRDSIPLVAGIDYTFAYDSLTDVITLAPLPPVGASFGDGSYAVSLSSLIEDLANNSLAPTTISVLVDTSLPAIVAFQDGNNGYSGTKDTYLHEDAAGTVQGTNVKVNADGDDDLGTAETNAQVVTGLIRFDALFDSPSGSRSGGPIPDGATILSAILSVRTGTASGDVSASTFNLHRMIATWDESATWNSLSSGISYDDTESASTSTASVVGPNTAGALVTFDVTTDVQLWSNDNSLSLRGWAIRPGSSSGFPPVAGQTDGWWFDSSEAATIANRPMLTVTYAVVPTNVSAGGPYTIAEGDLLNLNASALGTGPLTYSWDINGDGAFGDAVGSSPAVSWAQLVALGINNGLATRDVAVRVQDGYGHTVDSAATLLTINNVAPTADAGGPYSIAPGDDLFLDASASADPGPVDILSYSWDINGDDIFGDALGVTPTVTAAQRAVLGIAPGSVSNVRVQAGDGETVSVSPPTTLTVLSPSMIIGRQLFYNGSGTSTRYDHNDLAINSFDDAAIATDKTAYLWEDAGAATFANVSSYTKGINGIMVDIAGPHGTITAADFIFRVGNNNSPGLWTTANAPTSISVRAGAGVSGSDRVEIIWNTGAPFKQWLEVITLATDNTGLPQKAGYPAGQADAFFFGNAPGNTGTGDTGSNSLVNSLDEAAIRANNALVNANIPITNVYDVGRNASVNVVDESAARLNGTNPSTTLKYLNLTTAPAAPEADGGDVSPLVAGDSASGDSGVASALTASAPTAAPAGLPRWILNRLDSVDLNSGAPAKLFQHLHDVNMPATQALLQKFDAAADALGLDDELLDSLLADFD